ncbi:MAG: LysM peptidoglycan-binding domain-containing protein [Anaerolineaceae bacterium]|nr:LysM peptidoglycan-binding domain-containing protein [Anaerolineaceae bacterium]
MKKIRFLLLLAVLCSLTLPKTKVQSAAPSPYDLIAAVNALRVSQGLNPVEIDNALMASAQGQADYLASISPNVGDGHSGPGGSRPPDRAVAAGYPLGPGMNVIECWAADAPSTPISEIIYGTWSDDLHWRTMNATDAIHVGAGIAEGGGLVYYILDLGVKYGSGGSSTSGGVASTIPTTAVTAQVAPVQVATPDAEGKIVHVVKSLQTLWGIAVAYDITIDQIKTTNGLKTDTIFTGQELVIQAAYTPTPSPTATLTPRPPTRTPIPQQTAQPVGTAVEKGKVNNGAKSILNMDRKTMGLALILICGIGLALMIIGTASKDKKPPKQDDL